MKPVFFATPAAFRAWLARQHRTASELWVGFYKRSSGRPSITWPESVDEALCYGWIDGIRKTIDETAYMIRFTPRRPESTWSAVNVRRVKDLTRLGRMAPAGLRAFERRSPAKTGTYTYEQRHQIQLDAAYEEQLRANAKAWAFFQAQPPWYRRMAVYWVMSAKKEETRMERLAALIDDSARGRTVPPLTRPSGSRRS
jgi:uncharacterized protein YdeI (YjbR/CyaY-like superfamily)